MLRKLLTIILLFGFSYSSFSQSQSGTLKGKVTENDSSEPIPMANIVIELNGVIVGGAVADFDGFFQTLAGASPFPMNNSVITYDFAPPTGLWSVDGLLPNGRGYTLMANAFIAAINEQFGATVPLGNPTNAPGPPFPVTID